MKNKEIDVVRLVNAINSVTQVEGKEVELKKDLKMDDLIELKEAVSPINNYITQGLTESFIKKLPDLFAIISKKEVVELLLNNKNTNVNGNGFDFVLEQPVKIIAEIKANRPYAKTKYGAAQITGIKKDINGLLNGKTKASIKDTSDYYKFQILLNYEKNGYSSESAIKNFINNFKVCECKLLDDDASCSKKDIVYILLLDVQDK